jgi:hypothetical protein
LKSAIPFLSNKNNACIIQEILRKTEMFNIKHQRKKELPVIGAPPSRIGGSHLSFTIVSSQSSISGSPGADGVSEKKYRKLTTNIKKI